MEPVKEPRAVALHISDNAIKLGLGMLNDYDLALQFFSDLRLTPSFDLIISILFKMDVAGKKPEDFRSSSYDEDDDDDDDDEGDGGVGLLDAKQGREMIDFIQYQLERQQDWAVCQYLMFVLSAIAYANSVDIIKEEESSPGKLSITKEEDAKFSLPDVDPETFLTLIEMSENDDGQTVVAAKKTIALYSQDFLERLDESLKASPILDFLKQRIYLLTVLILEAANDLAKKRVGSPSSLEKPESKG